jgi:hypothetical protein
VLASASRYRFSFGAQALGKVIFRLVGGTAIGFGLSLFAIGTFTIWRYPWASRRDVLPLLASVTVLLVAGMGLLYLRKWAALLISCFALYAGVFWELREALHPIPGQADWLGFAFALLLTIPSVVTARFWGVLVWRALPRI